MSGWWRGDIGGTFFLLVLLVELVHRNGLFRNIFYISSVDGERGGIEMNLLDGRLNGLQRVPILSFVLLSPLDLFPD